MTFIRYVILLVFSFFIGFSISKYTSNTLKRRIQRNKNTFKNLERTKVQKDLKERIRKMGIGLLCTDFTIIENI